MLCWHGTALVVMAKSALEERCSYLAIGLGSDSVTAQVLFRHYRLQMEKSSYCRQLAEITTLHDFYRQYVADKQT